MVHHRFESAEWPPKLSHFPRAAEPPKEIPPPCRRATPYGLAASNPHAQRLRVAELVRIRALGSHPRAELVGRRPPRRLKAVAELEGALLVGSRRRERAPLAAIEHLEINHLAPRRQRLAAELAGECHRLAV